MTPVDAIYQGGVFKPLGPVDVAENATVRLHVEPVPARDVRAWAEKARANRQRLFEQHGYYPDISKEIAEDRARDE